MANEKNLKPFSKENQPKNRGRKPGIPNRATVLKKWLETKTKVEGVSGDVSMYDAAAIGLIKAAISGNHKAFQEIQDTLHGKLTDKHELDVDVNLPSLEDLKKKFAERRKAVEKLDD